MVNYSAAALDATFGALADPTRRAVLAPLARGESSIVELAEPFDVSLPAILKHIHVLETAGLPARQKDCRVNRCRLVAEPMAMERVVEPRAPGWGNAVPNRGLLRSTPG